MRNKIIIGTSLLLAIFSTNAIAIIPGGYMGATIGYGATQDKTRGSNKTTNTNGIGGGLFFGDKFSNYGATEYGYMHWPNGNSGINPSNGSTVIHNDSLNFLGKGMFSIASLNLFAGAGVAVLRSSGGGSAINQRNTKIQTSVKPLVTVGGTFDMSQKNAVTLSYTQLFVNNSLISRIGLVALTFEYHFVDEYCGQFLC